MLNIFKTSLESDFVVMRHFRYVKDFGDLIRL
jgi:hypothetical protein